MVTLDSPLRLIRIPHKSEDLGYQPYTAGSQITPHELTNEQVASVFLNMIVPCHPDFVPAQMEIKEASVERGKLPPRVCLLSSDMQTYKVFALPEDPFGEALKGRRENVLP